MRETVAPVIHLLMGSSLALAAASAALAIQSATVAQPAPLKSAGPWNVQYADNMCLLQRSFGSGDQAIVLGFQPGMLSEHGRIILIRPASNSGLAHGVAEISFDEGVSSFKGSYFEDLLKDGKTRAAMIDFKQADLAPMNAASQINLRVGNFTTSLALSAIAKAMKAIDTCQRDLFVSWGMDPIVVRSIAAFPKAIGGVTSFFSTDDYPTDALRTNSQGTVGARLWVDTSGRVSDCSVIQSSRSKPLDSRTCAVVRKRGRFEPARSLNGEAVNSIAFIRIRWEIPE